MSSVYVISHHDALYYRFAPGPYHAVRTGWRRWMKPPSLLLFRRGTSGHARYRSTSEPEQLERAVRDLSEATWGSAWMAGEVDTGRRRWGVYANNLGVALLDAYQRWERVDVLDGAIACLQLSAESLPDDSPARARALGNLVTAVETRLATRSDGAKLPDLAELRRELSSVASAPTRMRLEAARSWGYSMAEAEGLASGLAGLSAAVELLPQAAWWGHAREIRERLLADYAGLATDAAACAIAAGQPARALELLEGGRAVLWRQLLMTRTDRTALHEVAPRLAKRMDRVAAALERDSGMHADKRMALARRWSKLDRRSNAKLRREWERLAKRAQDTLPDGAFSMPDFGRNLRPAGAEGPVVIVNVSGLGCSALIVRDGEKVPRIVALPGLSYDDAQARAKQYVEALTNEDGREREQVVGDTLDWLWEVVASPVLNALDERRSGETAPGQKTVVPRLWWCLTGSLVMLPLHAAARQTQEGSLGAAVLDRVVSSYTPSMLVLVRARERRAAGQATPAVADQRLLHVTMSEQPGHESLPGAARTRAYLEALVPADRRTTLEGAAAIRRSVEAEMARHTWAHFDCHGFQDLNSPFRSGLVLRDQTLTVADLAGVRRNRAEFAFLAACSTAVGGTQLPDEVITVTTALQHAGYQHVIGTLSVVPDRFAARITRTVYDALADDGQLRPSESARALHNALRRERSRYPQLPSTWAPFVHVGL